MTSNSETTSQDQNTNFPSFIENSAYLEAYDILSIFITQFDLLCAVLMKIGNAAVKLYIYLFLHKGASYKTRFLADELGLSYRTTWQTLHKLKDFGLVKHKKRFKELWWRLKS